MAINRVNLMGNLTRDAELREFEDGGAVLNFGIAVNEKRRDKASGEWVDAPVFVNCSMFGNRARSLAPHLPKGVKVAIDGKLRYSSYMKDDEKRHALSVVVTELQFADSRKASDGASQEEEPSIPELYDEDIPF